MAISIPLLFAFTCLVLAGLVIVWLFTERRAVRRECERLRHELSERTRQYDDLHTRSGVLERDLAEVQASRQAIEELSEKTSKQIQEVFKAAAGDALKLSGEHFLMIAKKSLEGHQKDATHQLEQRKQAIETLVNPVKELLEKYQGSVQKIEASRREAYGSLREQLGSLIDDQKQLRDQTANLVKALRRPEVRGRWGELHLRRVAEMSGMVENCDFSEQVTLHADGGMLRPDMVVHLPSDRQIVVDAKTPLDAYLNGVEAESEEDREGFYNQHTKQIEDRVKELASKRYTQQFNQTPDFVVLFIPGEPFLYEAAQRRPDLLESAMAKGVVIATPMTLISLLKVVAVGWREQQIAESARQISEVGKELHKRLCTAIEHLGKVGSSLENAVQQYNKFVGSFESRLLTSARRFEELGAGSSQKLPNQMKALEVQTREPKPVVNEF